MKSVLRGVTISRLSQNDFYGIQIRNVKKVLLVGSDIDSTRNSGQVPQSYCPVPPISSRHICILHKSRNNSCYMLICFVQRSSTDCVPAVLVFILMRLIHLVGFRSKIVQFKKNLLSIWRSFHAAESFPS